MRTTGFGIGLALVLAVAGTAAASEPGLGRRHQTPITSGAFDVALFDTAVAHYANAARRAHGRPALARDDRLLRAAAAHAQNMAALRIHSHRLPVTGEGRLVQRMDRNGVRYRTAAENIGMEKVLRLLGRPIAASGRGCAFAYADDGAPVPVHSYASLAQSAVARWMASPKHRASLLSKSFRRIGSAAAIDPTGPACGDVYLVQNFAD
jgi:uncharacterized protein YkwD